MATDIIADPLNLVSFGLGKFGEAGKLVTDAAALSKADSLNPLVRTTGQLYNGLTANGSGAVKFLVAHAIGPATSGIVRAYNVARFTGLRSALGKESPELVGLFDQYMGTNHLQAIRAVLGKTFGQRWDPVSRELNAGKDAIEQGILKQTDLIGKSPDVAKMVNADVENLIREHRFDKVAGLATDDQVRAVGSKMLMSAFGVSPEATARVLGGLKGKALKEAVGILDGAQYGKAVQDFVKIREGLATHKSFTIAKNAGRYTPLDKGTATDKNVEQALSEIAHPQSGGTASGLTPAGKGKATKKVTETYDAGAAMRWREQLDVLRTNLSPNATAEEVVKMLRALKNDNNLVTEITKGLPKDLQAWSESTGYKVGLSPESGWKATIDQDGKVIVGDAFVHVQSGVAPTQFRNPLGRLGDNMFAAIHQRQLVLSSEFRLGDTLVKKGFGSEADARFIHRAALRDAFERHTTPRGLLNEAAKSPKSLGEKGPRLHNRVQELFADRLGPEKYKALLAKDNPEFLFLNAIRGNFSEVGYSQWLTGWLKAKETQGLGTHWLTALTERLYPAARFVYNPFFQLQERVETVFWKVFRGVVNQQIDPLVRKAISDAMDGSPEARTFDALGSTYLHGGEAAAKNALEKSGLAGHIRSGLTNLTDVQGSKQEAVVQQIFKEYPEQFAKTMRLEEPELWARMVEDAGTNDAAIVANKWLTEHMNLTNDVGVEKMLADAKAAAGGAAYRAGEFDKGVALDNEAKALRGETGGGHVPGFADTAAAFRDKREALINEFPKPGPSKTPEKDYKAWANKIDDLLAQSPEGKALAKINTEVRPVLDTKPFNPDEETIWQAWRYSLRQTAQVAKQTQYFREGRGWLERSLNHPFLGLYPLSYASKVFMEFGRFLLKRPFGLDAPLMGAASLNKVQQAILVEMSDPKSGMAVLVKKNPILVNFINQMLPYWPTNVSVNAPLWVKDLAAQAEAGQKVPAALRTKKGQNVTFQDLGAAVMNQSKLYLSAPLRLPLEVIPGVVQQGYEGPLTDLLGKDPALGGFH